MAGFDSHAEKDCAQYLALETTMDYSQLFYNIVTTIITVIIVHSNVHSSFIHSFTHLWSRISVKISFSDYLCLLSFWYYYLHFCSAVKICLATAVGSF